jgi:hypothetical protein
VCGPALCHVVVIFMFSPLSLKIRHASRRKDSPGRLER